MVKHYNPSLSEDAARLFNNKQGEYLPSETAAFIQPTVELKRRCNIVRDTGNLTGATVTVYTTPTDKDFYLVTAQLSAAQDVVSANTRVLMKCTVDGVSRAILNIAMIPSTVQRGETSDSYPNPIKVDRGTTIQIACNTGASGTQTNYGSIIGYTVETTKL